MQHRGDSALGYFSQCIHGSRRTIKPGNTVAAFGYGPSASSLSQPAKPFDAGRIFAVDAIPSRLDLARAQGAEVIHFEQEDPIEALKEQERQGQSPVLLGLVRNGTVVPSKNLTQREPLAYKVVDKLETSQSEQLAA